MKILLFVTSASALLFAVTPDLYAGKAGAAIGGFIGGTIVGSAMAAPRPRETVVIQQAIPVESSSTVSRLRRENQDLREDNRYLQDENRTLARENSTLKQEVDIAEREVNALNKELSLLHKENKQLQSDNARLEKEAATTVNKEKVDSKEF